MALDALDLLKRSEVGAALTALQHDQNLAAIEAAFNQLRAVFLVSHDEDGALRPAAIPSTLPTPGAAGAVLTSAGVDQTPVWVASAGDGLGIVKMLAGSTLPTGWLLCDGTLHLLSAYPALAAYLGTAFGGDGIATFAVPDFRGRGPVGVGTGTATDATAWALAAKRGTEKHVLVEGENAAHTHTVTVQGSAEDNGDVGSYVVTAYESTYGTRQIATTSSSGSGTAHNNIQPSLGINFIIKATA